jgi:hypothetical protein
MAGDGGGAASGAALPSVRLPLLQRDGRIHTTGGLNWGQRHGRDPNQAYIPVPAEVARSGFFPPPKQHFTVLTDDDRTLICVRAQANGKAIETPANNSLLGEYFRARLGLPAGVFIQKADLLRYGRTDVEFLKLDEDTFFLDFSAPARM